MRRVVMSHPLHNERWQLLTGKIVGYRRPTNKNSRSGKPRYLIQFEEGLGHAEDQVLQRAPYSLPLSIFLFSSPLNSRTLPSSYGSARSFPEARHPVANPARTRGAGSTLWRDPIHPHKVQNNRTERRRVSGAHPHGLGRERGGEGRAA